MPIDGIEDLARQTVRFEQVEELEQCPRVRRGLAIEVDAAEAADGLAILYRVLDALTWSC